MIFIQRNMKVANVWFIGLLIFLLSVLGFLKLNDSSLNQHFADHMSDIERMMKIIQLQNQTIAALTNDSPDIEYTEKLLLSMKSLHEKELEIMRLKEQILQSQKHRKEETGHQQSNEVEKASNHGFLLTPNKLLDECEERYGLQLIENWRKSKQVWCSSETDGSSLICYPYKQHHKSHQDMFCEASNFVIDFSKVLYEPLS